MQISIYDTVAKKLIPGVFVGVVVSAEGHIISVAHVVKPNQLYQVAFTDGTKYLAKGLGRIAVKGSNELKNFDLALMKISMQGKWRYAKMAPRSSMKVGQPCIGISSPASFSKKEPNIRYGRITDIDSTNTFFVSTCKMEPGDSGGPLYDALGRVIGIHSWITIGEEKNYEIPIDLFRAYWSPLNQPIDYKQLPAKMH